VKFVYKEIVRPRLRNKRGDNKKNELVAKKGVQTCVCMCGTERLDV